MLALPGFRDQQKNNEQKRTMRLFRSAAKLDIVYPIGVYWDNKLSQFLSVLKHIILHENIELDWW